jgi:hypothetical protein
LKKEPKNFCILGARAGPDGEANEKSFLFLFFKKEMLPCFGPGLISTSIGSSEKGAGS